MPQGTGHVPPRLSRGGKQQADIEQEVHAENLSNLSQVGVSENRGP